VPVSPLDPRAEGVNDLLRDGATFCTKAEDVTGALAEQNLSREQPDAGFFEPGLVNGPYEPLWDELDLTDAEDAVSFAAVPWQPDIAQGIATSGSAGAPTEKPAVGRKRSSSGWPLFWDRYRCRWTNLPAWRKLRPVRCGRLCSP
jgi:hypothetical protein